MSEITFTQTITVEQNQTAEHLGSGLLPVFSTPAMIALMENTAMKCMHDTPEGSTSVGVEICVKHLKASVVGANITCSATVLKTDGRKYSFRVEARDAGNEIVGEGTHERVVVNTERFMSKL